MKYRIEISSVAEAEADGAFLSKFQAWQKQKRMVHFYGYLKLPLLQRQANGIQGYYKQLSPYLKCLNADH